jgi:hypothetical protein
MTAPHTCMPVDTTPHASSEGNAKRCQERIPYVRTYRFIRSPSEFPPFSDLAVYQPSSYCQRQIPMHCHTHRLPFDGTIIYHVANNPRRSPHFDLPFLQTAEKCRLASSSESRIDSCGCVYPGMDAALKGGRWQG